jgi:hypothetical protein
VIASTPTWERMAVLAPVFVAGAGLVIGVLILLARAFADSWRSTSHKRLIVVSMIGLVGVVIVLTYLGVNLPNTE